jgi:hypothetical protein
MISQKIKNVTRIPRNLVAQYFNYQLISLGEFLVPWWRKKAWCLGALVAKKGIDYRN